MALILNEKTLSVCATCDACINNYPCRFLRKGSVKFRMSGIQTKEYWEYYYAQNKEKLNAKSRAWYHNNKCKQYSSHYARQNNKDKPLNCSKCGGEGKIIAHHPDYSDPLNIIWLCNSCHLKEHRRKK